MRKETGLMAEWGKLGEQKQQAKEPIAHAAHPRTKRKKAARQRNLDAADPTGWLQHTPYHWSRYIDGKKLDYWPSRRKWMYEGRVMNGDIEGFIRKREA